jgi:multimeric flavodoxin WrbA
VKEEDKIRIVGISTSPRKAANTERMVGEALLASERLGAEFGFAVETELITLSKRKLFPCYNCDLCIEQRRHCPVEDDWLNIVIRITEPVPNGLIFGSPVYFFNVNSHGRAFMERFTGLMKKIWLPDFPYDPPDFSQTAAGAIAVGADRHGGIEHTLSEIIHWLLIMGFVTVGGFYIGGGGWTHEDDSRDAIRKDKLGLESARLVGQKVAKTAILLKRGAATFEKELPFILWKEQK